MPLTRVVTNQELSTSEERRGLLGALSERTAELLGKPESYVMVTLETGRDVLFGGGDEPAAYVELASLGLPQDRTGELSAGLCDVLSERLGVPPARTYIHFQDVERHLWGTNRTTFG
ncbi:MAG: phenylpyruvate tautomerase MIF-related protein [Thiohalorhabdus sp.]|uniref:phenylpyruvate tautomerase MIF-related protein n=1 Tax=Thiohalorhabdus sp. TaxID=3094134 RepID=UPI00397FB2C7